MKQRNEMSTINNTNFNIPSARVPLALSELKSTYPEITLTNESDAQNLQQILFILGFHTRVKNDGSIFTLNRIKSKQAKDPEQVLEILSKYVFDDEVTTIDIINEVDEKISPEESSSEDEDNDEDSLIDFVNDVTETEILSPSYCVTTMEETKSEPVIDSKVVKKKRGRPKKST